MELRRFEKSDWNAFSGSQVFDDGSEPLVGEAGNFMMLADAAGFEVYLDDETAWYLGAEITPAFAQVFAQGLPVTLGHDDLKAMGFQNEA
jgi:hypothetical protein